MHEPTAVCVCAQFQGMLWRLLGHALDLSNPESDTLLEEALRLLASVLSCAAGFRPALQVRKAARRDAPVLCLCKMIGQAWCPCSLPGQDDRPGMMPLFSAWAR